MRMRSENPMWLNTHNQFYGPGFHKGSQELIRPKAIVREARHNQQKELEHSDIALKEKKKSNLILIMYIVRVPSEARVCHMF